MNDWQDLRKKNEENMLQEMSALKPGEQVILSETIKFEMDNRHINSPSYKVELKRIIERNIRSAGEHEGGAR